MHVVLSIPITKEVLTKQFAKVFQTNPSWCINYAPLNLHPWTEAGVLVGNVLEVVALSFVWQMDYSP